MEHKSHSICNGASGHSETKACASLFLLFSKFSVLSPNVKATSGTAYCCWPYPRRWAGCRTSWWNFLLEQDTLSAPSLIMGAGKPDDHDSPSRSEVRTGVHSLVNTGASPFSWTCRPCPSIGYKHIQNTHQLYRA